MRIALVVLVLFLLATPAAAETAVFTVRPAVGYRNGRPHRIKVVSLGWAEVEVSTARAYLAMAAAAAEDGIELWITSGFRSQEEQRAFYQAYREGWGNRAARPGHSNHQSGAALDLYVGGGVYDWLARNARRFGFKRTVPGEPWHWEHVKRPRAKRQHRGHGHRRVAAWRPPAEGRGRSADFRPLAMPRAPDARWD